MRGKGREEGVRERGKERGGLTGLMLCVREREHVCVMCAWCVIHKP